MCVLACTYIHIFCMCIVCVSLLTAVTEKDELLQAKERELAEAQQQLRLQVSLM